MFYPLSHKPYENMAVKNHILELEILLMLILVNEGCFKFAFFSYVKLFNLDLLRIYHSIEGHSLEYSFFCAPVDSELLVSLVLLKVIDLVFRQSLLLYNREVPVKRFYIDADFLLIMDDDGNVFFCVCDADVCRTVFKVWLAVVVVVEVHLLLEHLIDKCSYSQFLFSLAFASEERNLFHFVSRNRSDIL